MTDSNLLFFASTATTSEEDTATTSDNAQLQKSTSSESDGKTQTRILGSQELLMLPRQYQPKLDSGESYFPSMSHVSVLKLSATPSIDALSQAIDIAMNTHTLLRAHVEGDGEPSERIDLFQMVRKGEPNPCTFVAPPVATFGSKDVLQVVDVEVDVDESWKHNFNADIDDGSWYEKATTTGPLWKLTLHRSKDGSADSPCAIVFSANHCISDQSSVNMLMDQILADIVSIEEGRENDNKACNRIYQWRWKIQY